MKNQKLTVRRVVTYLNNPDEGGGFWLPNIQRPFVWTEEQICRLFDSILREYPISTLLVWKTTSQIRRRKFIDNWKSSLRLSDFYVPEDSKRKCLVLDGQQRLQSLFIALQGSYEGRELHFDVLSGQITAPDDVKYKFAFRNATGDAFPWVKFKDLVFTTKNARQLATDLEAKAVAASVALTDKDRDRIKDHLDLIDRTFKMEETISYQELDSIDNPELYSEDDVVEIFIRANDGGTKLGKSDLLFSLLIASWDVADERLDDLLDAMNAHGFAFTRDFVLKTCLVLLGHGSRYEVSKFRKSGVLEEIQEKWEAVADAIRDVLDFVRGKTFIQCDKGLPSYNVLIPLVYVRYHFEKEWETAQGVDEYILRSSLAGAFSGNPDNLLDAVTVKLKDLKRFDVDELFGVMRTQGRSLELTDGRLWEMGYGSNTAHLLFNLWYRQFNYTPAYENNMPQVDHIFPQSILKKVKVENPKTKRMDLMKYRDADRNQLPNCMLLTRGENGGGGKSDTPPSQWFADKSEAYLDMHLIPRDKTLWEIDRFEEFIAERKKLIRQKFAAFLVPAVNAEPTEP
jgi:Protein of unknown function DUF262/Protein of unknown function (DUF1524)